MTEKTIYVKISQNVLVHDRNVTLEDVATIYCSDQAVERQVKQLKLYLFPNSTKKNAFIQKKDSNNGQLITGKSDNTGGNGQQYRVFSILKVIEIIQQKYPNAQISNEGEKDFVLEYTPLSNPKSLMAIIKTGLMIVLIFFGAAFSIMAFNNDISVGDVFTKFYYQITGMQSDGVTELEISYCIGLAIGITVFFNHIGKKKLTPDPTPLQVEMRKYETDVNTTYIENAGREGKELDHDGT